MTSAQPAIEPEFLPSAKPVLIDFDAAGFVVVGCGDTEDLVARISIEGARDWRPRRGIMTRTLSEAWPKARARR